MPISSFAHGKILLSGEYFILDGALGLALPTAHYGQGLSLTEGEIPNEMRWQAFDETGSKWLDARVSLPNCSLLSANDAPTAEMLVTVLKAAKSLNPMFLSTETAINVATSLNFPRNWGLGTSSTLTYLVANWANIDPFALNNLTFKSSGYDVACANRTQAFTYQKTLGQPESRRTENIALKPELTEKMYFVHLRQKQNSREGIAHYKKIPQTERLQLADECTAITQQIIAATNLSELDAAIRAHETFIADNLSLKKAKNLYFPDFWGGIKSLGAWGGDFVLATSDATPDATKKYFEEKGYETVLSYKKLIG